LVFEVIGTPVPKGSMRAFVPKGWARAVITHDSEKTKPWQEAVEATARVAAGGAPPIDEAVVLYLWFFMPRPKSAKNRRRPETKPDFDKLTRLISDALTKAEVYTDDSRVVESHTYLHYAGGEGDPAGPCGPPRVAVRVELLGEVAA
jgi:Holliday junction resolvase RusA-like endonuclease